MVSLKKGKERKKSARGGREEGERVGSKRCVREWGDEERDDDVVVIG